MRMILRNTPLKVYSNLKPETIQFELWMNGLEEICVLCGFSFSSALEMVSGSSRGNRNGREL